MGDFQFYPDLNEKLNYIFNIHEIIDKITPGEFDKYLEIVKFTLEFLKTDAKSVILSINDINSIYKKINHIIKCSSKSHRFMKDELEFLTRFRDFFDVNKGNISLHIVMEVFDIHHVRWMGIINYWRYHMNCTGIITVNGHSEYIDDVEIAEYIRFR